MSHTSYAPPSSPHNNGHSPIILHTQSTNSNNISPPSQPPPPPPPPSITEDEMWVDYPIFNLFTDLVYPNHNNASSSTQPPPCPPPPPPVMQGAKRATDLDPGSKVKPQPVETPRVQPEMTVVESNGSPTIVADGDGSDVDSMPYSDMDLEMSNATNEAISETILDMEAMNEASEDSEVEYVAAKKSKHANGSTRSMTSYTTEEDYNSEEMRREDRIFRALLIAFREFIPNLQESDEASMLDEITDFVKTLQMQFNNLFLGSPALYQPRYINPMGTGVMSAGMGMRMARPIMTYRSCVPYPVLQTSPAAVLPNQTATSPYPVYPVAAPGFSVMRPNNPPNTINSSLLGMQQYRIVGNPHQQYMNPYQQYMFLPQMQMQTPQVEMEMQFAEDDLSPPQPALSSESSKSATSNEHTDEKEG